MPDTTAPDVTTEDLRKQTVKFLHDYFMLRKKQQEFFKKRSKHALIYCKEAEPKLDAKAHELHRLLTEPELFVTETAN